MIEIRPVKTRKEKREFLNFPLYLYKDNPYFVPPLYIDEKKIFNKDYVYYDTCEAVYFNAYDDGKMVGRISGILQKAANKKNNEKRIRFTRFDAVDRFEVSEALFKAVEDWGRSLGMDTICGPLGFSDLEREGLLIEGFDQLATFEEQYNAPYYQEHIEKLGYTKEVDWFESKVRPRKDTIDQMRKMSDFIMKRYNLHKGDAKNVNEFIKKYADKFFDLLDKSYERIYGTVPFTDNMKKMMIDNFRLIIKLKYVCVVLDENDNMVLLGLAFPSLSKAVQKSGGKLTPAGIVRILKAANSAEVIDLGLVGVDPEWENRGVSVIVAAMMYDLLVHDKIDHAETNLNLEDNASIRNLWKQRFDSEEHKKRRSYIKKL